MLYISSAHQRLYIRLTPNVQLFFQAGVMRMIPAFFLGVRDGRGRANRRRHNDDPFPYVNFMNKHYGEEVVSELHELRMTPQKVEDEELRALLEDYRRMAR